MACDLKIRDKIIDLSRDVRVAKEYMKRHPPADRADALSGPAYQVRLANEQLSNAKAAMRKGRCQDARVLVLRATHKLRAFRQIIQNGGRR